MTNYLLLILAQPKYNCPNNALLDRSQIFRSDRYYTSKICKGKKIHQPSEELHVLKGASVGLLEALG